MLTTGQSCVYCQTFVCWCWSTGVFFASKALWIKVIRLNIRCWNVSVIILIDFCSVLTVFAGDFRVPGFLFCCISFGFYYLISFHRCMLFYHEDNCAIFCPLVRCVLWITVKQINDYYYYYFVDCTVWLFLFLAVAVLGWVRGGTGNPYPNCGPPSPLFVATWITASWKATIDVKICTVL